MNILRLYACISVVFATAASTACSDSGDDSSSDDGPVDSGSTESDGDASTPTEGDGDASTPTDCTPIPSAPGTSNPATWYCKDLGYESKGNTCQFADGTECAEWDFFYGKCGQAHSFCEMHGGKVTYETGIVDASWESGGAVCTLPNGKRCLDYDFARTCVCE